METTDKSWFGKNMFQFIIPQTISHVSMFQTMFRYAVGGGGEVKVKYNVPFFEIHNSQ